MVKRARSVVKLSALAYTAPCMTYQVILFDADGTLFDYDRAERMAFTRSCDHYGVGYDPDVHLPLYRRLNAALWRELEQGNITPHALKSERFRQLFEIMEADVDPEAFGQTYLEFLGEGDYLLDGAEQVVRRLARTVPLGIVTNGLSRVQRKRFSTTPIADCFRTIVISDEIGSKKPDPRIFEIALHAFPDAPRRSVLMVGDSLTSDIAGGAAFGIDTCWYNPDGVRNESEHTPTHQIRTLAELETLLL